MSQFTEKRLRIRAVRTDCSGRGSKLVGDALGGEEGDPGRDGISSGGTGQGGMGFGSPQRCRNASKEG